MRDLPGRDCIGEKAQAKTIPPPSVTITFRTIERIGTEYRQLRHLSDIHGLH